MVSGDLLYYVFIKAYKHNKRKVSFIFFVYLDDAANSPSNDEVNFFADIYNNII